MHPCCNIIQEKSSKLPGNLDWTHILYSKVKIALIFLPAIRLKDTRHPRRRGKEKLFDIFDYYLMTCVHSNSITNCYKLSWQQQSCSFIFSRFNKFTQPRLISRLSLTPHCLSSNSCTCSIWHIDEDDKKTL